MGLELNFIFLGMGGNFSKVTFGYIYRKLQVFEGTKGDGKLAEGVASERASGDLDGVWA